MGAGNNLENLENMLERGQKEQESTFPIVHGEPYK